MLKIEEIIEDIKERISVALEDIEDLIFDYNYESKCSNCEHKFMVRYSLTPKYCPLCGKTFEGGIEERKTER